MLDMLRILSGRLLKTISARNIQRVKGLPTLITLMTKKR